MRKKTAKIRVSKQVKEELGLTDIMNVGRYVGGVVAEVIAHDPFNTMKLVHDKELFLDEPASKRLRYVYNKKKSGKNF